MLSDDCILIVPFHTSSAANGLLLTLVCRGKWVPFLRFFGVRSWWWRIFLGVLGAGVVHPVPSKSPLGIQAGAAARSCDLGDAVGAEKVAVDSESNAVAPMGSECVSLPSKKVVSLASVATMRVNGGCRSELASEWLCGALLSRDFFAFRARCDASFT